MTILNNLNDLSLTLAESRSKIMNDHNGYANITACIVDKRSRVLRNWTQQIQY